VSEIFSCVSSGKDREAVKSSYMAGQLSERDFWLRKQRERPRSGQIELHGMAAE